MAAPVYATTDDLIAYCANETPPASIGERQLRDASRRVDAMLLTAVYRVDSSGAPIDPTVIEALKEATCAQALHRDTYGTESEIIEDGKPMSLGPLKIGLGDRGGSSGSASVSAWAPDALDILRAEGLVVGPLQ